MRTLALVAFALLVNACCGVAPLPDGSENTYYGDDGGNGDAAPADAAPASNDATDSDAGPAVH